MKRAPRPTKRERKGLEAPGPPCSRPLRAQLVPQAPVRVGEHPREHVRRVDLLAADELDRFRATHGDRAEQALDLVGELEALVDERLRAAGLTQALGKLPTCPTLAVFVCLACGASDIGSDVRSGVVARTLDRTKLAERDLRRIEALLAEAWAPEPPPSLDRLPPHALLELVALVGADVDLSAARGPRSGVDEPRARLPRRAQVAALGDAQPSAPPPNGKRGRCRASARSGRPTSRRSSSTRSWRSASTRPA